MILTDRSRIECWQKCPRKEWWNYEYKGRGIVKNRPNSAALVFGGAMHETIGYLLMAEEPHLVYQEWPDNCRAAEQQALYEALTLAWAKVRLPVYLEHYDVLIVERELPPVDIGGIGLMVRADAILRRKSDGAMFVANWKTTKRADARWRNQFEIDSQTIGEVLGAEAYYGTKFSGVIVEGLLKGEEREWPKGSGSYYFDSPLIWAWHNESGKHHPMGEWSAAWDWTDSEGGNHTLGKRWKRQPVWSAYPGGVKAWVESLFANQPYVLEAQFVPLQPILRNDFHVERWKRMVCHQEQIVERAKWLTNKDFSMLDLEFPMYTASGNCLWPSQCEYFSLCWENGDPDDEERWKLREPNHSTELVQIGGTSDVL